MSHYLDCVKSPRAGVAREHREGSVLRCLVLATAGEPGDECAGVDLATGAILRWRGGVTQDAAGAMDDSCTDATVPGSPLVPLAAAEIRLGLPIEPLDPARPEEVALAAPPAMLGRIRPRRARRLLGALAGFYGKGALLGSIGSSVPYGDLDGSRPSLALLAPESGPDVFPGADGKLPTCAFTLGGVEHVLPLLDHRARAAAAMLPGTVLSRAGLGAMLGHDPRFLVVALVGPYAGHARKAIIGIVPAP